MVLHRDAEGDLGAIYEVDEEAAADIDAFLEEASNNQETLDNLTRRGYVNHDAEPPYSVSEWERLKRESYNLWRAKLLWLKGTSDYRIIYAFHPREFRYYVLGVLHRDFNYDIRDERSKRIVAAYDALDIPRY